VSHSDGWRRKSADEADADGDTALDMNFMCILYNQRDATSTVFFITIGALYVSGGFFAHHQELIKLYVQPWVLSCFPAVYSNTPAVDSR
jgi:hypothetical protein